MIIREYIMYGDEDWWWGIRVIDGVLTHWIQGNGAAEQWEMEEPKYGKETNEAPDRRGQ